MSLKGLNMKNLSVQNLLLVGGAVVLVYALIQYTSRKSSEGLNYALNSDANLGKVDGANQEMLSPSQPSGQLSGQPSGELNSNELLPAGNNNDPNAPVMQQQLGQNFLNYGQDVGINTVNSSLRNPNLQLRPEPTIPPNPQLCAWNMSTIGLDDKVNMEGGGSGFERAGVGMGDQM